MDSCSTIYRQTINRSYITIFKRLTTFYDEFFFSHSSYHPEPSVVVSYPPNETIKSERNITYIVLYLLYVFVSSALKINSIGLTLVVSMPVIVSSFFLSISILNVYTALPLHLISFHNVKPESSSIFFFLAPKSVPEIFKIEANVTS